jgi:hypothetical protein
VPRAQLVKVLRVETLLVPLQTPKGVVVVVVVLAKPEPTQLPTPLGLVVTVFRPLLLARLQFVLAAVAVLGEEQLPAHVTEALGVALPVFGTLQQHLLPQLAL